MDSESLRHGKAQTLPEETFATTSGRSCVIRDWFLRKRSTKTGNMQAIIGQANQSGPQCSCCVPTGCPLPPDLHISLLPPFNSQKNGWWEGTQVSVHIFYHSGYSGLMRARPPVGDEGKRGRREKQKRQGNFWATKSRTAFPAYKTVYLDHKSDCILINNRFLQRWKIPFGNCFGNISQKSGKDDLYE